LIDEIYNESNTTGGVVATTFSFIHYALPIPDPWNRMVGVLPGEGATE
jgi:hypothetical protein